MPHRTSFRLDYFINDLTFTSEPAGSLVVSKQTVERVLPGSHIQEDNLLQRTQHSQIKFAKIARTLQKKILLLELDFKQMRLTDAEGVKVYKHNWEQLFADKTFLELIHKYNYSRAACEQALLTAPVLATDPKSNVFNLMLCQFLTRDTMHSLELPPEAVIVVSGEMIWSRWINTFILTQLFTSWFQSQNLAAIIDTHGIWPALVHQSGNELMQLDRQYFEPNFFYFGQYKTSNRIAKIELKSLEENETKTLITAPDRAMIFGLGQRYLYDQTVVQGDIYFANRKMSDFTPRSYSAWWPQMQFQLEQLPEYKSRSELDFQINSIEFDLRIAELNLGTGESIVQGQLLGDVYPEVKHYQPVSTKKGTNIKLAMLEGQLVKAGDPLYYVQGKLLTKTVYSQFTGQVSYERLPQGLITINVEQRATKLRSIFSGKVLSASKKQARIAAVSLQLSAYRLVGKPCQGMLVADLNEATLYPKIIVLEWQKFLQLTEYDLIQSEVELVILTGVSQLEFVQYVKQHSVLLSWLNLLLVDTFAEASTKLLSLLDKFMGSFCVVSVAGISLVLNSQEQKQYLDLISKKAEPRGYEQGQLICLISYEQPLQYVRIDKSISELNLANVLFHG